ncbi:hypothetical protein [Exiguobacterium sp. s5]|uniref:hypothetical protein n=1 Tax=Exiguobacterium sp. s5 TaxID=2751239 RepID=UPI001BEAE44B|nr:hypothetical protein [Exiguobacterium sp. s5]
MSNEISLKSFHQLLNNDKISFLCGNGLSLNFDGDFLNIYDNLYSSHKKIIRGASYKIKSNSSFKRKCNENYRSVIQYIRAFDEKKLMEIFEDALKFAELIVKDDELISDLKEQKKTYELVFGVTHIDIVKMICKAGKSGGIQSVNIENWTILIYLYFAIKESKYHGLKYLFDNSFIKIIEMGNISRVRLIYDTKSSYELYEKVILNGFTTYYRFLFSTAILSNGKAINFEMLENVPNLDIQKIRLFLNQFDLFLTLNYDNIPESLYDKDVHHLHGKFVINSEEYVYGQSLGLSTSNGYVSFSDILIGDYFIFKTLLPTINKLANSNKHNKKVVTFSNKIESLMNDYEIQTVVIFGMNIENDHHVLRNIMLSFYNNEVASPHIVYCYFSNEEKIQFANAFQEVITFREDVSEYSRAIKVSYLKTKELLKEYFY